MFDYLALKTAHVSLVGVSLSLFFLRAYWATEDRLKHKGPWTTRLPILIDTLLLTSGITLIYTGGFSPMYHHWLAIKLLLLVLYVISGGFALKHHQLMMRRRFTLIAFTLVSTMIALAHLKPAFT